VNDGLIDAFHHNTWAMRRLLLHCQDLTEAQLEAAVLGTYGSITATLWHTVSSEAGYCVRLTGGELRADRRSDGSPGLDQLAEHIDNLAVCWDRFLTQPFDAERTFVVNWHDGIDRDVPAGVFLAQALHHGNEHRAQICTILSSIGVTPPALGLWDYAEATNRANPRTAKRTDKRSNVIR
jgi:uncharacterized damage-inducible protein DinB